MKKENSSRKPSEEIHTENHLVVKFLTYTHFPVVILIGFLHPNMKAGEFSSLRCGSFTVGGVFLLRAPAVLHFKAAFPLSTETQL